MVETLISVDAARRCFNKLSRVQHHLRTCQDPSSSWSSSMVFELPKRRIVTTLNDHDPEHHDE